MAKGIVLEFGAPADELEESAEDEETSAPPRQDPSALISSIETQLAELRRSLAEIG